MEDEMAEKPKLWHATGILILVLDNRKGELTSAFIIHCHLRQHQVFFIKQSVVYFVLHMGVTHVAF